MTSSPGYIGHVEYAITQPGIEVRQSENGAMWVRNENPDLVGQIIVIKARTEDGELVDVPLTMPPVQP